MVWFDPSLRFQLCETGNNGLLVTPPIKACHSRFDGHADNPPINVCFTGFNAFVQGWKKQ